MATFHDLPGVGCNLQEHPGIAMTFKARVRVEFDRQVRLDRFIAAAVRWKLTGRGALATLPFIALAFMKTRPDLDLPDVELLFTPTTPDARIWFPGWRSARGGQLAVSVFLMRPASRGWVRLRSSDPADAPRIRLNLLEQPSDLHTLIRGIRLVRAFMANEPAASLIEHEQAPDPDNTGDPELAAFIRRSIRTMQHPTSSCAMGSHPNAVVGPDLRVRGLEALRVIDASVMPAIVSGHINATTVMIAEKGADLILHRATHATAEGTGN